MKSKPFTTYDKRTIALLKTFTAYDRRIIGGLVRMLERFPPPLPTDVMPDGRRKALMRPESLRGRASSSEGSPIAAAADSSPRPRPDARASARDSARRRQDSDGGTGAGGRASSE